MTITDTHNTMEFVDQYLQVWNEPDPDARKELVRRLWATDAVEYTNANEYRGHTSLDERVTNAHTQFVEEGGKVFRLKTEPVTHHGAVLIAVDMIPKEGGEPVWTGTIIALLGRDGRIEREYQFGRNL
jgi:uncharacterized protein